MKSHTNEHTVRGRPTLKVVKRFRNGSVCKAYERSIYERTFWVNLSRIMLYQSSYQPGLSTLQLDKKHLQKRHRIFGRDREPSTNSQRLTSKSRKVREFVSVVYECICSGTPKLNALRNFVKYSKVKILTYTIFSSYFLVTEICVFLKKNERGKTKLSLHICQAKILCWVTNCSICPIVFVLS